MTANEYGLRVLKNVLKLTIVRIAQLCTYLKNH